MQVAIATIIRRLVEHSAFIALCTSTTDIGDLGGGVGPSSTTADSSRGGQQR